ncbi:MAG: class III signal peptide-containing protein [Candidatus Omnitrophica bacterium]|nr:class III signal peptide-containing protein [Candidatus Omnitrophota bacterium]MDE2009515.1 class III signal peptide-containing protein [Candidatus Omnitrophota bacterium]MDE2214559.1 class III signal peptide-containing protein [Candidatus Omnitrophota bacterium]MDE2231636.1 class III signal peptide-containing protein [Candidatus Omnitrophota bacterium]
MRARKGQSLVEYILLVTAVIVVVVLFTTGKGTGSFQSSLNSVFNQTTQGMLNAATYLQENAANGM